MKELKVGSMVKINTWTATVVKLEGGYALLRLASGSQVCYGSVGIRQSQILEDESFKPGAQLQLL
jgi:hypothetical protein